jgi:thiol:disulfide interchange protein DsbD
MTRNVAMIAGLATALIGPGARADDLVVTPNAETRLLSEYEGLAPGKTAWLILDQKLRDGWHVYWKNPGDSGLPLDLQWTLPEGYVAGAPVYPIPERIPVGPFANYGFHGRPAFLVPVSAPATAKPGLVVEIGLKATWLICEEICVPEEGAFSIALPVTPSPSLSEEGSARAEAARAATARSFDAAGAYAIVGATLVFDIAAPDGVGKEAYFFPDADGILEPSEAQKVTVSNGRLRIEVPAGRAAAEAGDITGVVGFDARGARRGYETRFVRDSALKASSASTPSTGADGGVQGRADSVGTAGGAILALLLLSALAGGLLLNIMPCVFPVLFIKAATLMKQAGADGAIVRRDGLAYTAGVLSAFCALGGALIAFRAAGAGLGWGFHLQSPIVILLSAYILFAVGLNLAGVFHVGSSLQGAGAGLAAKGGPLGAYFTGLLAVVVAAPCVGPLLTAPVGAAALLPPAEGLAIFAAMGLGLAAPFLALAFFPRLGRFLPRPGAWMETARQALSFPVFAGAAYFLWVLTVQTGTEGLARALAGAVLIAAAAWAFERARRRPRGALLKGASLAALAVAVAQTALLRPAPAEAAAGVFKHAALTAENYSHERLDALRAEGRPVFVDFTAAWCVTCQFNKATIFSDGKLADAFERKGVAVLVADWTARDPQITEALAGFGANGVPLYAFYPPGREAAIAAQPLTVAALEKLINAEGERP